MEKINRCLDCKIIISNQGKRCRKCCFKGENNPNFKHGKIHDIRPWGTYIILEKWPGHWVKIIEVNPGQRLSFQYHNHRSEEWIVVQGNGYVIKDQDVIRVREGSHLHIDVGDTHRMCNDGLLPLVFIEVALGAKLTEDDIVRLDDDYGRVK